MAAALLELYKLATQKSPHARTVYYYVLHGELAVINIIRLLIVSLLG